MMNQKYSVQIETRNRKIAKELERMVLTVGGLRISAANERPDLLIFELSDKLDEDFQLLTSLSASNAVGEVILTSEKQDTDLFRQAMRIGAKEFLSQPLIEKEVKTALEAFKKRIEVSAAQAPTHKGQIIHMLGAKGGVGTTTVAVNLAMILAGLKQVGSVALVDLNTVFGEIPLFLSIKPTYHWGQIAKNVNRLDSTFLLNAMAKHSSGVYILPSPNYLNGNQQETADIMDRLVDAMKKTFDFIIIDGGQSLGGHALRTMALSDQVVLISLLSLPCLHNTNNVLKSLASSQTVAPDRIRLVINRYLKKSDISIKEAEESLKSRIFWNIPNDYKTTMSAINRGMPLYDIAPKAAITRNMAALADALVDSDQKVPEKRGWRLFRS